MITNLKSLNQLINIYLPNNLSNVDDERNIFMVIVTKPNNKITIRKLTDRK